MAAGLTINADRAPNRRCGEREGLRTGAMLTARRPRPATAITRVARSFDPGEHPRAKDGTGHIPGAVAGDGDPGWKNELTGSQFDRRHPESLLHWH